MGPVAQRSEQRTHNPLVLGSNPSGPTNLTSQCRGSLPFGRGSATGHRFRRTNWCEEHVLTVRSALCVRSQGGSSHVQTRERGKYPPTSALRPTPARSNSIRTWQLKASGLLPLSASPSSCRPCLSFSRLCGAVQLLVWTSLASIGEYAGLAALLSAEA